MQLNYSVKIWLSLVVLSLIILSWLNMPGDYGTIGSDDEYYLGLLSSDQEFSRYDKSFIWKSSLQNLGKYLGLEWSSYFIRIGLYLCYLVVLWRHLNVPLFFIIYFFSTLLFKDGWFALGLVLLIRWHNTESIRALLFSMILLILTRPYVTLIYFLLPKLYPKKLNWGIWSIIIVFFGLIIFRDNYLFMLPFNGTQFLEYFGDRSTGVLFLDSLLIPLRSFFSLNPITQFKNLVLGTPFYDWYSWLFNLLVFFMSFYFVRFSFSFFKYKKVDIILVPVLMVYVLPYMLLYNGLVGLRLSLVMYLLLLLRAQIKEDEKSPKHLWFK